MMRRILAAFLFLSTAMTALAVHADEVILSFTGKASHDFTATDLAAMPQTTIKTATPWTDGVHTYQGVLLRDLLKQVGAGDAKVLIAKALNNYATEVQVADAKKYDVILALSQNGKAMSRRNKGPVWVLYPMTDYPELNKPSYHSAMIWQLRSLQVKE